MIHNLTTYRHRILYYGPESIDKVVSELERLHVNKVNLKSVPVKKEFVEDVMDKPIVYVVDY